MLQILEILNLVMVVDRVIREEGMMKGREEVEEEGVKGIPKTFKIEVRTIITTEDHTMVADLEAED